MDLPHDMIDMVLGRLDVRDIARVAATCTGIHIYADENDGVRLTALRIMRSMKSVDLAKSTATLVCMLHHSSINNALVALSYIAPSDLKTHAVEIVQGGAIAPLISLLELDESRAMICISILHVVASVKESYDATPNITCSTHWAPLRLIDACSLIVVRLRDRHNKKFTLLVTQTLTLIAAHSAKNSLYIIECRVFPHLLDMIYGYEPNDVEEAAVMLLHALSVHIDTRIRLKIIEAGAIASLVKFLDTVREDRIKDVVTDCLTNLGWQSS